MKLINIIAPHTSPGFSSSAHLTTPLYHIFFHDFDFEEAESDGYLLIKI